mgnify:CR=1 FL=1
MAEASATTTARPAGAAGPRTLALHARAAAVFPDGRLTAADTRPHPVVMARGAGARIFDADGREYLDFHLSSGALVLGHGHPAVQAAVAAQVADGFNFGAMNRPAIELAERICAAVPSVERVKFTVSGTEATLHAIRMARALTGRDLILRFEGGYHGHLDMVSLSNKLAGLGPADADTPPGLRPIPDCAGIPEAILDLCLVAPFNDAERVAEIFASHGDRIAGVIVEPLQRFIEPLPGFLQALREETRRAGAVLIFDEIVTGFRLAPGGAQQLYGVAPDLTVMGKIIGAGFPNGAIGGPAAIMEALFAPGAKRGTYLAGTFAGHPVAAAGGAATLAVLAEPGAHARLTALGDRLRRGVAAALAEAGVAGQVLCPGAMFHIALTDRPVTDARSALREDRAGRKRLWDALLARGIHITGGRGFVSLQHDEADIDAFVERFADALQELSAQA